MHDSSPVGSGAVRLAVETSTDCVKVLGLDGSLEYMNQGGMCVMEIDDFAPFQGACWPDFWHGEERAKANKALDQARAGGVGRFQGYTATAKGSLRYWDVTVTPVPGPDGRPERLLSVSRDVTDQRVVEEERERLVTELRAERERSAEANAMLRLVTDRLPVRVAYVDKDLRYRFLNGEYARVYGRSVQDAVGRPVAELAGDAALEAARPAIERALAGEAFAETLEVEYPFGRIWAEARFEPDVAEGGEVRGVVVQVTDVTERVRAEGALADERARLVDLLDAAPAFTALLEGPELRFTFTSREYRALIGHRDVLGLPVREALPEVEGQGFFETLDGVLASGEPKGGREVPIKLQRVPSGPLEDRYVDFLYQAMRGPDGRPQGVFVQGVDVTDQVLARRAIAEREELFRTVFEQAPDDAILVMGLDRALTAWNPAAERIVGWSAEEAIGRPADLIFTPEDRAAGAPAGETATAAREGRAEDERWHLRRDGSRFWGSGTMNSLHDEGGAVRGFLKVFRDATERHAQHAERERLLAELETERARLRQFFHLAPAFLCVLRGPELVFDYVNQAYYGLVGHRPLLGLPLVQAIPEATGGGEGRDYDRLLRGIVEEGRPQTFRERPVTIQPEPGGPLEERYLDLAYIPLPKVDGEEAGVLVHGVDVTDQVLARRATNELNEVLEARVEERTAQLAQRTADLERAVEQAEGFSYSISHDLRTPLRAIAMTSSILLEEAGPELSPFHREQLDRQAAAASRMGVLIDGLLQLSRLARAEMRRKPIDLSAEARAVGRFESSCEVEVQDGLAVEGDPGMVASVLQNLVGNACKFSPKGGTIRVGQGEDGAFYVADEGVGFDMAYAAKVFLPFERLVSDEAFPGTGIGLANVKRIVERHGGRVWCESEPGRGSTFWFTLGGANERS